MLPPFPPYVSGLVFDWLLRGSQNVRALALSIYSNLRDLEVAHLRISAIRCFGVIVEVGPCLRRRANPLRTT